VNLRITNRLNTSFQHRLIHTKELKNVLAYEPLLDIITRRRREARRSVMVQVKDAKSAPDLFSYCSTNIGQVKEMHFFRNKETKLFTNFYIVEFEDENCVLEVLDKGSHGGTDTNNKLHIPVTSPFLWLSGTRAKNPRAADDSIPLYNDTLEDTERPPLLNLSDQIYHMWKSSEISESNTRVRYMVCRQVELAVRGMFFNATVLPFGSSVNGFGQHSGDQDMVLALDPRERNKEEMSRLVFHSKSFVYGGENAQTRRYLDQISDIINVFLPGCQDVQKILFARVPIIKYRQELTGMDCDLSFMTRSGVYMSCLLHVWGGIDWRVRPLVAVVKHWAKSQKLVKDVRPTNYLTNFSIVMMVVCYLQQVHRMLPSVCELESMSSDKDVFICEDGVRVSFLHNVGPHISSLNQSFSSDISLLQLLHGFFEFYSEFDFVANSLNPVNGTTELKNKKWQKSSAMDIINPIEPALNVSYNVNASAVRLLSERCREASKRCGKLVDNQPGADLSAIFGGKQKQRAQSTKAFAIPNISDVGLDGKEKAERTQSKPSESRSADNKLITDEKKSKINIDINLMFGKQGSLIQGNEDNLLKKDKERTRIQKEKSIRSSNKRPVFKHML